MIDFKYMKEGEYNKVCYSCGWEAPLHFFEEKDELSGRQSRYICECCATSFIGNATMYPQQHYNIALFQAIAQIGNLLLDKLTDRRKEIE